MNCCGRYPKLEILADSSGHARDDIIYRRTTVLKHVLYTSVPMLTCGALALILGIITTVLGSNDGFPFDSGYGIWTSIIFVIGGAVGMLMSRYDVKYEELPPPGFRSAFLCFWTMSLMGGSSFGGLSFGYSIGGLLNLRDTHTSHSDMNSTTDANDHVIENAEQLRPILVIVTILSFILIICSWVGMSFFIRHRGLFVIFTGYGYYAALLSRKQVQTHHHPPDNTNGPTQYTSFGNTGFGQNYSNFPQQNKNELHPPPYSKT